MGSACPARLERRASPRPSSPTRSTARTPNRTGASPSTALRTRGRAARTRRPRSLRPQLEDRQRTGPAGHRLRRPGPRRPVRPEPRDQTAAAAAAPVQADQPTGLAVDLDFPQSNDPTDPEHRPSNPKPPRPPSPRTSPSSSPPGSASRPPRPTASAPALTWPPTRPATRSTTTTPNRSTCPDSSKIGTAIATSPLLALHDPITDAVIGAEPIPGGVYLLKPHPGDLPIGGGNQDGKFRLLIQLENERYGINFKLPGVATADPQHRPADRDLHRKPAAARQPPHRQPQGRPAGPAGEPDHLRQLRDHHRPRPLVDAGHPRRPPDAPASTSARARTAPPARLRPAARPFAPTMSAGTESSHRRPVQPLHPPHRPRRRRTGTELPRSDPAQGPRRQVHRRPLLLRGGPGRGRRQERRRRAGQPQLPGRLADRHGHGRRRPRHRPLLRPRQRLPRRPLQRRPAERRGHHPGGRRSLRPRHRRQSATPSSSTPKPPRATSSPIPARRSSTASRCGCARSTSGSTGRTSP